MMIFACVVMAAALLFFVFNLPVAVEHPTEKTRLSFLRERKESVYENLRDLNFEYKAGKMPEADYANLRASLEDEAAAVLTEIGVLESQQGVSALIT